MNKPTWTGLPEIEPIPTKRPVDLEQAENMKAILGKEIWEGLERKEMNLDPDEAYFIDRERVRDLLPSEMEPKHQLGIFFNPDASETEKEAALESFEWPWPKVSFETLSELDALTPDHEKGKEAAIRYLNKEKVDPAPVTIRATVTLPLLLGVVLAATLIIMSAVIRG